MEQIMNYVKPELMIVAVVLYFIGMSLKHAQALSAPMGAELSSRIEALEQKLESEEE